MKGKKLHINFHNPNTEEETAKFFTKLLANIVDQNTAHLNYKACKTFQDNDASLLSEKNVI